MLEDVLGFGKRRLFVEKFFALERGEEAIEFVFRLGNDLAEKTQRELPPNDGELLKRAFSSAARRSMRAASTPCTVVGDMQVRVGSVRSGRSLLPLRSRTEHALAR